MADFIKTIDVLGDDAVIDSIINRTITEFKDDVVENVGMNVFRGCAALETIYLPNAKILNQEAFRDCKSLVRFGCPSLERIENNVFINAGIKNLVVPRLTYVNTTAFQSSKLESLEAPNLEGTARYVFQDCKDLTHVSAPKLPYVEIGVFYNCSALKQFETSPDLYSVRNTSFTNSGIEALIIRNADSVATLEDANAFTNTPIAAGNGYIYVPGSLAQNYASATNWSSYANQVRGIFEDDDILQGIIDGTLVDLHNNEIESIPDSGCRNYTNLKSVRSTSAREVGAYAFYNCTSLDTVEFPSVTTVGKFSFVNNAKLEVLDLPVVESIGTYAFQYSNALVAIIMRNTDKVTSAASTALSSCYAIHNAKTCFFYVPRAIIADYVATSPWSDYASQFRALEDYTVDGTTTGALDETKI